MGAHVGERFAAALAAKDWDGVDATLHPAVDFRGLTPGRAWEARTAGELVENVLTRWFGPGDDIYEVLDVSTDRIMGRHRVVYRFRLRNADGEFVCEQTAYYDVDADRITTLRVLCSGFLPSTVG